MTCSDFQVLIQRRADGELPLARAVELDAHLANCGACRQYSDCLEILLAGLSELGARTEGLIEPASPGHLSRCSARPAWRLPHWAGLAAAIAVTLTVVLWTERTEHPAAPTTSPPTRVELDPAPAATLALNKVSADEYIALRQDTSEPRVHVFMLIPTVRPEQ